MLFCLIAALLSAPLAGLKIETVVFRPAVSSPAIQEAGPRLEDLGGMLRLFVRNTGSAPVRPGGLTVDGTPVETLISEGKAFWWRALPALLQPGELGEISLNAPRALFAPGREVTVALEGGESRRVPLLPLPFSLAYVCFEDGVCRLFVRNDAPPDPFQPLLITLDRVALDGVPTGAPEFLQKTVAPGETAIIRLPLKAAPPKDRLLPLRVYARADMDRLKPVAGTGTGGGMELVAGAMVRALPLDFPIGTWDSAAWKDEARMADLAALGINANVWGAAGTETPSEEETRAFDVLCPKYGMKMLTFQGYPDLNLAFLKRRNGDPRILAAMIKDEPDWDRPRPGEPAPITQAAEKVRQAREAAPATPLYLNMARSRRFGEYAPLPDIASMDAYRVGAPKPDRWPKPWGGLLETARDYTADLKRDCEPAPAWVWSQGVADWDERVWVNGRLGRAVPTPEEAQAQLFFHLSRGAKGIFWFTTQTPDDARRAYREKAQQAAPFRDMPKEKRDALIEQIAGQFTETRAEIGRLSRLMQALGPLLARSEPSALVTVEDTSRPEKLDAAALVGERAVVVFLTNFDYRMEPTGYVFTPQSGLDVKVRTPRWLAPKLAFLVTPDGVQAVSWARDAQAARITLDRLPVGALLVVAEDSKVREEIAAALRK